MSVSKAVPSQPKVVLEPLNLHSAEEFRETLRQRVLCGWDQDIEIVEKWRDEIDADKRVLFWIHIPPSTSLDADSGDLNSLSSGQNRIGHIGFQAIPEDDSSLTELAGLGKSVLMISSFFILEKHRGNGVGRAAMEALEAMTQVEPYGSRDCQALILTALSQKYVDIDGGVSPDDWRYSRALWAKCGIPPQLKGTSIEKWYSRMGYSTWKEEHTYPITLLDGTEFRLLHAFMRKQLH